MIYLFAFLGIVSLIIGIILLVVFAKKRNERYKKFVEENSLALIALENINQRYDFLPVVNLNLHEEYDSDVNYNNVSCYDYMVYQLQYDKKEVLMYIANNRENMMEYPLYEEEVQGIGKLGRYKIECENFNVNKLNRIEIKLFYDRVARKPKPYCINVKLTYRDMGGNFRASKNCTFDQNEILDAIEKIRNKNGNFYRDRDIWDCICRVERAKVSNRIRFSIFKRDGERCKICGSRRNLEIDHIVPIAKGGKSVYTNLQTLCHRCNVDKGDSLYF